MTSSTMQSPTDSSKLVAEHLKASRELTKKLLKDKGSARAFLKKAGILGSNGKLSKHYRAD